jgi:hypothetical protein
MSNPDNDWLRRRRRVADRLILAIGLVACAGVLVLVAYAVTR